MILQALVELAENEKLIADPDFEFKPVSWIVRLQPDGGFVAVEDNRVNLNDGLTNDRGRPLPAKMAGQKRLVPIQFVRTSGDAAFFAVDKPDYIFGLTAAKPNRLGLFYRQLTECADATGDPSARAAAAFGAKLATMGTDARIALLPKDIATGDLMAFRVGVDTDLLHDRPAVKGYWKAQRSPPAGSVNVTTDRRCLISWTPVGEVEVFKKIKNMPGDDSGGLSLVSFNEPAWESYGWAKRDNAPVTREAAEAAVRALSRLLDPRPLNGVGDPLPVRRVRLGDNTAVVFWSPAPAAKVQGVLDALPVLFDPPDDIADVGTLLNAVRTGVTKELATPAAFYAMTLTSVTGRIVVRDWLASTVSDLEQNLRRHFADLDCVRQTPDAKGKPSRGVMRLDELMDAIAAPGAKAKIPTALASDFVHAAMHGTPYPFGILQRALLRARAEASGDEWADFVRRDARAAMLKAILNRRRRLDPEAADRYPEVYRDMDPTNDNIGYNLGALLAVLERLQEAALKMVNASVVDRYFNAASATPRNAFDRLLRNARHHAKKAQEDEDTKGQAFGLERLIDELVGRVNVSPTPPDSAVKPKRTPTPLAIGFPVSLDLEQQGLFVIGYHHMRKFLWMTREDRTAWQAAHPAAPAAFLRKLKDAPAELAAAVD